MNQKWTFLAHLDLDERADKYLHALLEDEEEAPSLSRSQIQKLIDQGAILVNGAPIKAKNRIPKNAEIELILPEPTTLLEVEPENIPISILYEDEHLVVVNKQPGLTIHPSETQKSGTLVNALLYHIKDLSGIGGKLRPGIVHRIDKETSGTLVVSKTDAAHQGLSKLFAKHDIERIYRAICYGSPVWEKQTLKTTIGRSPTDRKKMAVNVTPGREAISHFTVLESYGVPENHPFASLIEAKLETGRTHQIRVHLNHLRHSVLGDPAYGTPSSSQAKWKSLPSEVQTLTEALSGQALHAQTLGFVHPITGKSLRFEAEPFENYRRLLEALRTFR